MALGGNSPKQPLGGPHAGSNIADDTGGGGGVVMSPPPGTIRLWSEVANGIDKSQTVVWKNAVDSLQEASHYLLTSPEARRFVEGHMRPVISILLEQQPSKIGQMEKNCVEESLRLAVTIVADDLRAKADPSAGECTVLDVLAAVFNRKKIFYKGSKPSWNVNLIGLPEVRQGAIHKFRGMKGFSALATYLSSRVSGAQFPPPDVLHQLLTATADVIPTQSYFPENNNNNPPPSSSSRSSSTTATKTRSIEDESLRLAQAVMDYMGNASEDTLKRQAHDSLNTIRYDVQRIFEKLAPSRRREAYAFYEFWRHLTLKLITSQSLPLKLFGWEQVGEIIESSSEMRPPPKSFIVSNAGCTFCNGRYIYAGPLTEDGFARPQSEISYVRKIPDDVSEKEGRGKTITIFRCTMRSHQKWWFLSEADEEQPGTDKDTDYYSHKSKAHEEAEPPPFGWTTCRNSGVDPPPTLRASGLMVPAGEEYNTLEHQLAKWAIENKVIELVLGDSAHREVVARSVSLIKFLASMCERDDPSGSPPAGEVPNGGELPGPNAYCLKASHLLLAWKTCTSKADAAVSAEVYQLLVSILPSLPDELAVQLLSAIQESLRQSNDKRDYLFEVAEFCATLSATNHVDGGVDASSGRGGSGGATADRNGNGEAGGGVTVVAPAISDEVRTEVLKLMWAILTHPDASSLKSYDRLKSYVTNELRVEPMGRLHRERFLGSCKESLTMNARLPGGGESVVDEVLALRMVKLTRFVLEACPGEHAIHLVTVDDAAMAKLLFQELIAYLRRRSASSLNLAALKKSNSNLDTHTTALTERLNILRYAYGLSERADMTTEQLDRLWHLCSQPTDREALMVFLAKASYSESTVANTHTNSGNANDPALSSSTPGNTGVSPSVSSKQIMNAAVSEKVRLYAFQKLFCSTNVDWERLGAGAYQSFQILFKGIQRASSKRSIANDGTSPSSSGSALDALWNICLKAGNDDVASQAMKDLLAVYTTTNTNTTPTMSYATATATPSSPPNDYVNVETMVEDTPPIADSRQQQPSPPPQDSEDTFVKRIYSCLDAVKDNLAAGNDPTSHRSAERCLRILNAAVGHDTGANHRSSSSISSANDMSASAAALASLASLPPHTDLGGALRVIPHGMRGQSCYRTVMVVAKRAQPHPNSSRGSGNNGPSVMRFSVEVHPLETLTSLKTKVANDCHHPPALVKATSVTGRAVKSGDGMASGSTPANASLSVVSDESTVSQLGIGDGCEVIFFLASNPLPANATPPPPLSVTKGALDLANIFSPAAPSPGNHFFETLLAVLEALPLSSSQTPKLVWDLLLAMPTNPVIISRVRGASHPLSPPSPESSTGNSMSVDTPRRDEEWSALLSPRQAHRSVYVMQVVDSFLNPAPEVLSSILPREKRSELKRVMMGDGDAFRRGFVASGGFDAVLRLFTGRDGVTRMGKAVTLRVLKSCFFGNGVGRSGSGNGRRGGSSSPVDEAGRALLQSLSDPTGLLRSLTAVVVEDKKGVSDAAILDAIQLLRLLLLSDARMTDVFASLPNDEGRVFLTTLLLWECPMDGSSGVVSVARVNASTRVRRNAEELTLGIPSLSRRALPWLVAALDDDEVDVNSDATSEFFHVLQKLVENYDSAEEHHHHLTPLATAVCRQLGSHPRPTSDSAVIDFSTGVLCGCLRLLRALIERAGGTIFVTGTPLLLTLTNATPWTARVTTPLDPATTSLLTLAGVIFDSFLSSASSPSSTPICCDKDSRQRGFAVVSAAVRRCRGDEGYLALVSRVDEIIDRTAPSLRHRWSRDVEEHHHSGSGGHHGSGLGRTVLTGGHATASQYSGLRNQGCTCYMNSVLQQLFMMPHLRKNICRAPIPSVLRRSGVSSDKGRNLVGKTIAVHWESGVSYDATVERFDEVTGMHVIRYHPLNLVGPSQQHHPPQHHHMPHHPHHQGGGMGHQVPAPAPRQDDLSRLPENLPEEFFLSEGRPGKETGVFDVLPSRGDDNTTDAIPADDSRRAGESSREDAPHPSSTVDVSETDDEAVSRRLLEEVQRTFVHLEEGSRGRCFDPRSLVEASGCLKLEFDVWQQNDASEFAMKLLDRLEVSLKRWAPKHFRYLTHTFGLKQTKQKICKECGLKTNREENLMNIDCQIRGKADIHEALSTMCEVEFMEGDNKVFCDRCKKKCDTVLRTAISALPDVLVLSLKRFDLDYTTFETVKLNSRCAFDQTLNMKRYTLEGVEAMEKSAAAMAGAAAPGGMDDDVAMDTGEGVVVGGEGIEYPLEDPLGSLRDEDYEYKLVGVLVHAGVAQGGHYYSFIKDRSSPVTDGSNNASGSSEKWFRFDDEDVTPFDPSSIEVECFGGKVKKETKWPNGTVHTVESEQFANALMLFYEKVKPVTTVDDDDDGQQQIDDGDNDWPMDEQESKQSGGGTKQQQNLVFSSGYDVFQPDVRRSNTTHCWHTFLFDLEFQSFLKELLELCLMPSSPTPSTDTDTMDITTLSSSPSPPSQQTNSPSIPSYHHSIIQMSLTFVFDILLHSIDRNETATLHTWITTLTNAIRHDKASTRQFLHECAQRCNLVSANWLRVYATDCPEDHVRDAALELLTAAVRCGTLLGGEREALRRWTEGWRSQMEDYQRRMAVGGGSGSQRSGGGGVPDPLPTMLEGAWKMSEDASQLSTGRASAIGVIISTIAGLLELAPRSRFNSGLCTFIRDVAYPYPDERESTSSLLREALIAAQIPARLICLAIRDRAHPNLRLAFPGSSISYEIAEALVKNETPPASHLLPGMGQGGGGAGGVGMGHGGGVGAGGGGAGTTMPSQSDHMCLIEALGCIIGVPGVKRAVLVCESDVNSKGRSLITLSKGAKEALSIIFDESKSSEDGMGQKDIQHYMQRCGLDTSTVPPQKIASILNKYPTNTTTGSDGGKESRCLSLEGFLAYYRDTAQTNETQVRSDLHTFGFRQDLSRRSESTRWYIPPAPPGSHHPNRQHLLQSVESVAHDIDLLHQQTNKSKSLPELGPFAELGLLSFQLHSLAYGTCEPLAEYLLASACYGKDTNRLMTDALKALSRAPTGWAGSETFNACLMIFKVLVSIPDPRQLTRIENLMKSREKALPHAESGIGLIVAAKDLSTSTRSSPHYSNDFHYSAVERYINTVKELSKLQKVHEWMSKNRELWNWMEHWLRSSDGGMSQQHQVRSDIPGRRDGAIHPPPAPNHHSDSDMNPGMGNDSEEDNDSDYDNVDNYTGGGKVIVQGSGVPAVNGTYVLNDACDGVGKYMKEGNWKGQDETFSLFRCQLSDLSRRWYISIVPKNHVPGTNKDIDFYSAPALGGERENPPEKWTAAKEGCDPPPICIWKHDDDEDAEGGGRMWNGDGLEDGEDFQGSSQGGRELGFL